MDLPIEVGRFSDSPSFENDKRVRPIRRKTNQGAAAARNDGIAASDSHYVAFLDADDLARPHRLEIQVQAMEERRRFDILFARADVLSEGRRMRASSERLLPGDTPSLLFFRNCIIQSSFMLRRSCLQPFRSEFEPAEDYNLWARMSLEHSLLPLNGVLVIQICDRNSRVPTPELDAALMIVRFSHSQRG